MKMNQTMSNDEIAIERLEQAQDIYWSQHSIGGMYDFFIHPDPFVPHPKLLIPRHTDALGNLLEEQKK